MRRLLDQISGLTSFAISDRICCLHFTNGQHNFQVFSCYMPTSWESGDAAEHVYDLLGMLLLSCDHAGAIQIIGGNFNAVVGNLLPGDDSDLLGTSGCGPRNNRGWMLLRWVLEHGLLIQSRLDRNFRHDDSWTCQRSMDGVQVQMDYILSTLQFQLVKVKYDFATLIGLDHRCVHCTMKIPFRQKRVRKQSGFKCWRPILDDHGHPTSYQQHIREMIGSSTSLTASELENILLRAGVKHGTSRRQGIVFSASERLQILRVARRQTVEQHLRKDLSLQIRKIHRQELRQWKSNQLNRFLCNLSRWKDLRDYLPRPSGRRSVIYPHVDDFASGPCQPLQRPMRLTERGWDLSELRFAIRRLKTGTCGDELGLTAELLQNAPVEFLGMLLALYNTVLLTGERPESWCKTLFSMLPKKTWPLQPADFRPIATIRLLYKTFAYLLLRRLEHLLEAGQPEEQHGFRPGRRLEEHLVTANLMLDKSDAVGIPVWIISLDLSKAFNRVHWPALWRALVDEGIPVHLVWILQCVYFGQCGEVVGEMGQSRKFNITGGVRQGCVLSPRLFCAVLQWAMREWRAEVGNMGFNLMDGGPNCPNLLDLRFADDILFFAQSRVETGNPLDALVKQLDRVGLLLNPEKTMVITNEAQPPLQLE